MNTPESQRIAAELAALGEPEADLSEVDWGGDPDAADDLDLRTVSTLFAFGQTPDVQLAAPLSEIESRRVWKRVATAAAKAGVGAVTSVAATVADDVVAHPTVEPAPRRRTLLSTLAVVAAAAGIIFVPMLRGPGATGTMLDEDSRADLAAMGESAREGVEALGPMGGERARSLASDYARRMQEGSP